MITIRWQDHGPGENKALLAWIYQLVRQDRPVFSKIVVFSCEQGASSLAVLEPWICSKTIVRLYPCFYLFLLAIWALTQSPRVKLLKVSVLLGSLRAEERGLKVRSLSEQPGCPSASWVPASNCHVSHCSLWASFAFQGWAAGSLEEAEGTGAHGKKQWCEMKPLLGFDSDGGERAHPSTVRNGVKKTWPLHFFLSGSGSSGISLATTHLSVGLCTETR